MMKVALALLALVLSGFAQPAPAAAQCSDACTRLVKADGSLSGFGCIYDENANANCMATSTYCRLRSCTNVLLYTPAGQFAGMRDGCAERRIESARTVTQAIGDGGRRTVSTTRHVLVRRLALGLARTRPI
jgi:hypothetical protein